MNPLLDRFDFSFKLCFKKNTVPEEVLSEEYCNFIQRNQYAIYERGGFSRAESIPYPFLSNQTNISMYQHIDYRLYSVYCIQY